MCVRNNKLLLAAVLFLLGLLLRLWLPQGGAQARFRDAVTALGSLAGGREDVMTVMRQLP